MIGKRGKATMKRALKKTMMLLLAFTFMLSALAMMVPLEAQASNLIEISFNNPNYRAPGQTIGADSGNFGNMRVGYRVGSAATQVNPITVTVQNNTTSTQNLSIELVGGQRAHFTTSANSISIPAGLPRTFTVQPVAGLTLGANETSPRPSSTTIRVSGAGADVFDERTVTFTLHRQLQSTQQSGGANDIITTFGEVANGRNVNSPQLENHGGGNWRWTGVPSAGLAVTSGNSTRNQQVEFVFTYPDERMNIRATATVRVRVHAAPANSITPPGLAGESPRMGPIGVDQRLSDSAFLSNSQHTRGGTWSWVDRNGNDIGNFRPAGPGVDQEFFMRFSPNVSANFSNPTVAQRTFRVLINVTAPTVVFTATDVRVRVGGTLPAAADLRYTVEGLIGGAQAGASPTLRWNPDVNVDVSRPGEFANAILLDGGREPIGQEQHYAGVRHVAGRVIVYDPAAGGGTAPGGGGGVGTNWVVEGGNHYLRNAAGQNVQGWHQVGGNWFYLHTAATAARDNRPLASMATGWLRCLIYNNYYLLRDNGTMTTGWQQDDGNWYFMQDSGAMATNVWRQYGRDWYFLGANGVMEASNWVQFGGQWYWMNSEGIMVTGVHTIGGVRHRFASDGRWLGQG